MPCAVWTWGEGSSSAATEGVGEHAAGPGMLQGMSCMASHICSNEGCGSATLAAPRYLLVGTALGQLLAWECSRRVHAIIALVPSSLSPILPIARAFLRCLQGPNVPCANLALCVKCTQCVFNQHHVFNIVMLAPLLQRYGQLTVRSEAVPPCSGAARGVVRGVASGRDDRAR